MTEVTHSAHNGKFISTGSTAEMDAKVVELRKERLSFRQIAKQLNTTEATAHRAFKRAYATIVAPNVNELREIENDKLSEIEAGLWEVIEAKHYVVSQKGDIVKDGEFALQDNAPTVQAYGQLIRLSSERRKLNGLDIAIAKPNEQLTEAQIDDAIKRMLKQLAERKADAGLSVVA